MAKQTFAQLTSQIRLLQSQADALRITERAAILKQVSEMVRAHNITADELFGRGKKATATFPSKPTRAAPAKYEDGNGNVWGGMGPRPAWLRDAIAAGRDLNDFLAGTTPNGGNKVAAKKKSRAGIAAAKGGKYQDDMGNSWSGRGPKPRWLKDAIESGKTEEDFVV